jgi:signal peptidase
MVVMVFGAALAVASSVNGTVALVEHSDSMYPAIEAGDLVISQSISAQSAQAGDVVTFPDPDHSGKRLTHRVISMRRAGDLVVFDTRGDANTGHEQWTATTGSHLGRLVVVVPHVGSTVALLGTPAVAAGLNGLIAALLVLLALGWRRSRTQRAAGPSRPQPPVARAAPVQPAGTPFGTAYSSPG